MKGKISAAIAAVLLAALLCGCAPSLKYPTESCRFGKGEERTHREVYGLSERRSVFDRFYTSDSVTVYIEEGLSDKSADASIQKFIDIQTVYTQYFGQFPTTSVYVNDSTVTHIYHDELWLNCDDSVEYALAAVLAQSEEQKLPFGIYAGIAAQILGDDVSFIKYDDVELSAALSEYTYCNELQFPLYYKDYSTQDERTATWNFSLSLVSKFDGNYDTLLNMSQSELADCLTSKGATLTEYSFYLNDSYFPVKIQTENFIYYFQNGYADPYIDAEDFTTDYIHFKAMLSENERFINNFYSIIGAEATERIEVYLGQDLLTYATEKGGQAHSWAPTLNKLVCRTLGSVSYTSAYTALITLPSKDVSKLVWILSEVFACDNLYYRLFCYHSFNNYDPTMGNYDNAEEMWRGATALYNSHNSDSTKYDFDVEFYYDCMSYYKRQIDDGVVLMAEIGSLFIYIRNNYGTEAILEFYKEYKDVSIDGKDYEDLYAEWQTHLSTIFD